MLLPWMRKRAAAAPIVSPAKVTSRWRPALEELEERCVLATPVITSIAGSALPVSALNLPIGKSLIVPITATGSFPLNYTVTSDNPDVTVATHLGNPYLELDVNVPGFGAGVMTFEMLHDVAPNTVDTIDGLVQAGFYNGLTFHRVVKNFVIQGGDPAGNGTGGPGFQFDDEFNINAIFSGNGQLAMANSGPDTNGSQFFVTVGTQRSLDYTYTIFGQLLSGFSVLTAINNLPVGANNKPTNPVTITSAKLITDTTDSVVTLEADGLFAGSAHITVAVDDGHGGTTQTVFTVNAFNDATQTTPIVDPPFLQDPIPDVVTPINTTATIPVNVINIDNQALQFSGGIDTTKSSGTIDTPIGNSTNYRITPNLGVTGPLPLTVDVYKGFSIGGKPQFDSQTITIGVGTQALSSGSANPVTATALIPVSNVTVATFTDPNAGDTVSNFTTVTINWGDDHLSTGALTKSGNTFTVTGSNTYTNPGSYPVTVKIQNSLGATLHLKATATVTAFAGPVTLDIDGSGGQGAPLTDGILILRYLFNFSGTTLTSGALGAGATRTDPNAIKNYLAFARNSMLDVDNNGTVDPLTDGILILRYLFGFSGSTLTSGALGVGATRTDPTNIKSFLDGFNPGHLFADSVASGPASGEMLTDQELQAVTQAAVARWEATDLSSAARAALESAHVQLANLGGTGLGETFGNQVFIDRSAAGYGWFVDPTPLDDSEFATSTGTELHASTGSAIAGEMDLLTVVMHELGLVMGLKEYDPTVQANTLMTDVLSAGVRRLP